jgi:formylglycine-generating enzyme required for sulfatase activity
VRIRLSVLCGLAAMIWVTAIATMTASAAAAGVPARAPSRDIQLAGVVPKNSAEQFELAFWNSIKDSKQAGDYEAYLHAYPKGRFAALARARIQQLKSAPQAPAPVQQPATQPARPAESKPPEKKPARDQAQAKTAPKSQPAKIRPVPAAATDDDQEDVPAPAPGVAGAVAAVKDCDACPLMVALYPGPFTMGSNGSDPSERPAHKVALRTPFAIGKYEVTVDQWRQCIKANVCPTVPLPDDAPGGVPMRDLSWDEAQLYVKWLSSVSRKAYRLPTEAEWEYAARGGTTTRYWWGDEMKGGNSSCKGCGEPWKMEGPPRAAYSHSASVGSR